MNVYFYIFKVKPSLTNTNLIFAGEQEAYCWIKEENKVTAKKRLKFLIQKYHFEITDVIKNRLKAERESFEFNSHFTACFDIAQGVAREAVQFIQIDDDCVNGETIELSTPTVIDKMHYFNKAKKGKNLKLCMHFNAGDDCTHIIKAHSIQRQQMLEAIKEDSQVYRFKGTKFEKEGTETVASVFKGFCQKHDSSLFELIDRNVLFPDIKQCFLYSYRSLCRELFVQNQGIKKLTAVQPHIAEGSVENKFNQEVINNTEYAYQKLSRYKRTMDESLKNDDFNNYKAFVFKFNSPPSIAVSSVINPKFDFNGNHIQQLSLKSKAEPSHLLFSTAPMNSGWGLIFLWHKNDNDHCVQFIKSLINQPTAIYADCIFRFIISTCDNYAISPKWYDSQTKNNKEKILNKAVEITHPLFNENKNYLINDLSGIVDWNFEQIFEL